MEAPLPGCLLTPISWDCDMCRLAYCAVSAEGCCGAQKAMSQKRLDNAGARLQGGRQGGARAAGARLARRPVRRAGRGAAAGLLRGGQPQRCAPPSACSLSALSPAIRAVHMHATGCLMSPSFAVTGRQPRWFRGLIVHAPDGRTSACAAPKPHRPVLARPQPSSSWTGLLNGRH